MSNILCSVGIGGLQTKHYFLFGKKVFHNANFTSVIAPTI
jgi:hypothetical protein